MSDTKSWGSTVLGWFVVQEDGAGAPASPPGEAPSNAPDPPAFVTAPPPAPGGRVEFPKVYAAAGVGDEEQGRVAKAAQLLAALPAETEPAVKKQIVEASLKAFGVPIEKIIEGAVQEIQALEAYIRAGSLDTQAVHEESAKRIAQFEEEIARLKAVMEARTAEQLSVARACNDEKLGIQKVLEFFGRETVARVVRDSPKLVEPHGS
jgi:uncharacterized small protein (DUF1192 family)